MKKRIKEKEKRQLLLESLGKLFVWSSSALYMLFMALRRLGILGALIYDIEIVNKRYIKVKGRYSYCLIGIINGGGDDRFGEREPVFVLRLGFDAYEKESFLEKILPNYKRFVEFFAKGMLIFKNALHYLKKNGHDFNDADFLIKIMRRMGYDPDRSGITICKGVDDLIRDVTARLSANYLKKFVELVRRASDDDQSNRNELHDSSELDRMSFAEAEDEFRDMLRHANLEDETGTRIPRDMRKFAFLPHMERIVRKMEINGELYRKFKEAALKIKNANNEEEKNQANKKYIDLYKQIQEYVIMIAAASLEKVNKNEEIEAEIRKNKPQTQRMLNYLMRAIDLLKEYSEIEPKIMVLFNNLFNLGISSNIDR